MATQTRFIFGIWDDVTNDFVRYPDGTPVVRKSPRGWVPGEALPTLLELLKYFPLFEGLLSSINTSGCTTTLPVTPVTDPPVVSDSPLVFAFDQHYESAADEVVPYLVERYILVASSITEGAAPVQAVLMELYNNGSRRPYPGVVLWSMPSRPTSVITIDPSTGFITVPLDSISQNSLIGIQATIGADSPATSSIQLINVAPANPAPRVGNPAPDVLITIPGVQTFTLPADQFYDPGDTQTLSAFMLNGDGTLGPLPKSWPDNAARYIAVVFFGRGAYRRKGQLKRLFSVTMKHLISILLCLLALTVQAQTSQPLRIYRSGNLVIVADADGNAISARPANTISVGVVGTSVNIRADGNSLYLLAPANFLGPSGAPYSTSSAAAALASFQTATVGEVFGTVPPVITDYTSNAAVSLTGVVKVYVENVGATAAMITYGGFSYTLQATDMRIFEAERDPTSGRLAPYLALAVQPGTSTIRVTRYYKQL